MKKTIINPDKITTDESEVINSLDAILTEGEFTASEAMWLAEKSEENAGISARYYVMKFKDIPAAKFITAEGVEIMELMKMLKKEMGAEIIGNYKFFGFGFQWMRYTLSFPGKPYLLHTKHIARMAANKYEKAYFMEDDYDEDFENEGEKFTDNIYSEELTDGRMYTGQLIFLHPSDASGKRDLNFEAELENCIQTCTLEEKEDQPEIYTVQTLRGKFSLKSNPVQDGFEIKDLDLNYGEGFEKFHNDLMQRFQTQSKGLVLFHGEPGTGKTYYIRHLLRKMTASGKIVIYMPPNMVDFLMEPGFLTFISQEVKHYSQKGLFCVLLIEDAEPLLAARDSEVRIQGVTNLLNMTDGILNDMLNMQIICTFNVNIERLDKALLRPGRLLARKEFKPLAELEANILASRLGIKHHFTGPATLSEIYSFAKDKNTLIHDVNEED
jgi:hypothetical protein